MGNALTTVIKSFGNDSDKEKLAHDALYSLVALARDRQTSFREQITSSIYDVKSLAINKIIYEYQYLQVGVSSDPTAITKTVKDTLGGFISAGSVADGIGKLVGTSLDVLFGNYSANKSSLTTYAITTGSLGGVARIDADFFSYEYRSKRLSGITRNVVVVSVVVSSAEISDLKKNDVNVIVESVYKAATTEDRRKICAKIWKAVQKKNSSSDDDDDDEDDTDEDEDTSGGGDTKKKIAERADQDSKALKAGVKLDDPESEDDSENPFFHVVHSSDATFSRKIQSTRTKADKTRKRWVNALDEYHPSVFAGLNDGIHQSFDTSQFAK